MSNTANTVNFTIFNHQFRFLHVFLSLENIFLLNFSKTVKMAVLGLMWKIAIFSKFLKRDIKKFKNNSENLDI